MLSQVLKSVKNSAKEANEVHMIDVQITWVSNYRYPVTKSSN